MKILVIGAHGKVGKRLVSVLSQKGYEVISMIRNTDQTDEMLQLGGEVVIADLEKDFRKTYTNIDAIVFTAGSGGHTGPDKTISVDQEAAKKSIDLAVEMKINRYIMVSAQGARNPELPGPIQHYYKAKKTADDYLINSGLDYTIFRPGRLLDTEGNGKIWLGEFRAEKGETSRDNLAITICESIDKKETYKKIIEIFEGNTAIDTALSNLNF